MKIVHIIDELRMGGAQTHLVNMVCEMHRRGDHQHEVWCLFGDGEFRLNLEAAGIPVRLFDEAGHVRSRRYDKSLSKLVEVLRQSSPEVVEAHLSWSRLLALPAARLAGVGRRIGFEQGDIYMRSIPLRALNFMGQFAAQDIVVCSEALKKWVKATHYTQESRLRVFHNCVDVQVFQSTTEKKRAADWPQVQTLFVGVGTLGSGVNKRFDIIVEAAALARERGADVGVVVAGDGDQRGELERLVHTRGVAAFVKFLGMRRDVRDVMRNCDAFVHAAPFEPFGIVAIEAMASGIPVIVPDAGGISEAVLEGKTGFVYPVMRADALAKKMVEMHESPERRAQMGVLARSDVEERFSLTAYVDRMLDLYDGR